MNLIIVVLEEWLMLFEGGIGVVVIVFGMVVIIYFILNIVGFGDYIVVVVIFYGGMYMLFFYMFKIFGIDVMFVDFNEFENFEKVIKDNMKVVFIEIIGNFDINIVDIEKVVEIVYVFDILFIVDNIFVIVYLNCLFDFGVDIVVYLVIKFIGGYGVVIGGVVIDLGKFNWVNGKFLKLVVLDDSYNGLFYINDVGVVVYIIKLCVLFFCDIGVVFFLFNVFLFILGLEILFLCFE